MQLNRVACKVQYDDPHLFVLDWLDHNDEHLPFTQWTNCDHSLQSPFSLSNLFLFFFPIHMPCSNLLTSIPPKITGKSYTITWGLLYSSFFQHIPIIMLSFIYITQHSDSDRSSIGFRFFSMKEQWKMRFVLEKEKKVLLLLV